MNNLKDFDFTCFWEDSEDESPKKLTDKMVEKAERKLKYKLPAAYIQLLKSQNGGCPVNTCFPTSAPTSWAEDHIAIDAILGIGAEDRIDDKYGSLYMIEEWGYPEIGIIICSCPSAGHDAVMLDYSKCGNDGEPQVVHVDVEVQDEPVVTFLANNFEDFIRGLVNEEVYEE